MCGRTGPNDKGTIVVKHLTTAHHIPYEEPTFTFATPDRTMRRIIAILTAAAILAGVLPLGELAKLPHFIAHYLEHVVEDGSSFADYMEHHYAHTPESHRDAHHDAGCLPFQGGERVVHTPGLALMDRPSTEIVVVANTSAPATRIALAAEEDLPSATLESIFQPPRMG